MAFFGLTNMGHQNPIDDKMIGNYRRASLPQDGGTNITAELPQSLQVQQEPHSFPDKCNNNQQPTPSSADIHRGSQERYREMVRKIQTPRSPDQLYKMPLTDNQQYGWMASETPETWTQIKHFPRKNSEMTKFVKEMAMKGREFSLF